MCKIADCIIAVILIAAGYKDWKTKQISLRMLLLLGIAVVILRIAVVEDTIVSTLGGVLIGILLLGISKITGESIGYGDSWLIILLGIYLGGKILLVVVLGACVYAGLFSLLLCLKKGWNRKYTIPFVPFLAVAYLGVVFL
ncbi:MAG: prepilin peptidase [Tyzzerella sp.]|nr:prepilin peptidase [Tyzzerella sp.]